MKSSEKAGVKIGLDYPAPIVDEQIERNKGIQACYAARKDGMSNLDQSEFTILTGQKKRNQKKKASDEKKISGQKSLVDF